MNAVVAILLVIGIMLVRRNRYAQHERVMWTATGITVVFLITYVTRTMLFGTTVFEPTGWLRTLYLTVLFSHLSLAIAVVPLAIITLTHAVRRRFDKHGRIARILFPMWLYVSVTGPTVYLFLRPYY